ncbi:MAG: putative DinB family protein [Bryobacterales bacterium]|nr:putative DinB family protein [Bryobacterales bacterium]
MIRLQTVLDSWRKIREDTAQGVSDLPEAAMDEILVEGCMSFRETAFHILEVSHCVTGAILAGVDDMAVPNRRELLDRYKMHLPDSPSGEDLAEALLESMRDRTATFQEQPVEFWAGEITRFDGQRVTRLEMLQFLKEHELTHRSQLFMFLRLKGIVPPTTRRREAARRQPA